MFGHKWERAQATVVEARPGSRSPAGTPAGHEYIVDVRKPTGEVFRATIRHQGGSHLLAVGTVVGVEFEAKTGNVRFDPHDHTRTFGAIASALQAASEVMTSGTTPAGPAGSGVPGSGQAAAAAGPMQQALLAAMQNRAAGAQATAGPEAAQMLQALMSGDRNQRAAAIAELRQLRASGNLGALAGGLAAQASPPAAASPPSAPGPAGGPAPSTFDPVTPPASPSTFDPVTPPATPSTFSQPGSPSTFGPASSPSTFGPASSPSTFGPASSPGTFSQPGHPSTFDPIGTRPTAGTPSTFDPISPINTFSSPGSSFSGVGASNKTERIARLQALRDQGLLSNQDFETQRQQIIDEF